MTAGFSANGAWSESSMISILHLLRTVSMAYFVPLVLTDICCSIFLKIYQDTYSISV